jgi:glucan biosynthesis protein C
MAAREDKAMTAIANTSASNGSDRLHGLDAVRGYALLLGIVFHATASFLPTRYVWPVMDNHPSVVLAGVFYVSHIFRMTTFFLIAGFFAHMTFHRRGQAAFIKDRAKRIALPLVVGWPFVIAGIVAASAYGAFVATGHVPKAPPPMPHAPLAFPLTHLWFLYVLLLLYAATLLVRGVTARLDRSGRFRAGVDRAVRAVVRSPAAPMLLALPATAALYSFGPWLEWFGIPTPDFSFIPNPPAAVQFMTAFGFGWLLNRQTGLLQTWRSRWPLNLALAVALTVACIAMIGLTPVIAPAKPALARLAYAWAYSLAIWTWTFAVIGLALRFLSGFSLVRRYIADSSYWLYLIHLPLILALQAAVSRLDWPWEAKIATILGVGFPLMFASYQLLVRHSFIGSILNGRRAPKAAGMSQARKIPSQEVAR